MRFSLRPIRNLFRKFGLEVTYAKYSPRSTDQKIYKAFMPCRPIEIIFDVGANIGQSARSFRESFPHAKIFCFEPFDKIFRILQKNLGRTSDIKLFQIAFGDLPGQRDVLIDDLADSQYNSLTLSRQADLQGKSPCIERVTCVKGDDFCKNQDISRIDILKIDTEGFDLEVLRGFSGMIKSKKIGSICVEVGFLEDQGHSSLDKVMCFLQPLGYRLAGLYDSSYSSRGNLEYTNALFI